ncbi:MAG: hypothetical protein GY821_09640 [Gammaproteobacteria bacterium]|nr:hypothetical protein [Gammaproteobacteria bacterium]
MGLSHFRLDNANELIEKYLIDALIEKYDLDEMQYRKPLRRFLIHGEGDDDFGGNKEDILADREGLYRFLVYGEKNDLIKGKFKNDAREAKERLKKYRKQVEKKLKQIKKPINRLAKSLDIGTRIVKQSHPLVAFVDDIDNPKKYNELKEHLRKHQTAVHSGSRIWLVNKENNKGKLYVIKPNGKSFDFITNFSDSTDLEDVPGFTDEDDDGGTGQGTNGRNSKKHTIEQPFLSVPISHDDEENFSWYISYDNKCIRYKSTCNHHLTAHYR